MWSVLLGNFFVLPLVTEVTISPLKRVNDILVLLLGIFRRVLCPSAARGALVPFYFPGGTLLFLKKCFLFFKFFIGNLCYQLHLGAT
jgi:hypothetical protein